MRLIDADALIDEIKHITGQDTIMWFDDRNINRAQEVNMAAFIDLAPTIDPVKRGTCKSCKHKPKMPAGCREVFNLKFPDELCPCQCDDPWYNWEPDDDWFCANWEEMDGGKDDG